MFNKLKQIKDLKDQANQIKKALAGEKVEGLGQRGKVKIIMDGNQETQKVELDAEIVGNKEALEAGIKEATNDAIKKVQRVMAQKMQQIGGFNFPGM